MFGILEDFAKKVDEVSARRAPYDQDGGHSPSGVYQKSAKDMERLIRTTDFHLTDLSAYVDALMNINGVGLDDRFLLLEKVLFIISRLEGSQISDKLQKLAITLLYKDLPHPPATYVRTPRYISPSEFSPSHDVKYAFRSADGSSYNPLFPTMGMAGTPYARSVPTTKSIPKHLLPDAELVFDTLLRRDEFVPHPDGISSLFFAFADLVIHSIFNTDHFDEAINKTSSYLDLSILYGNSQKEMDQVRRKDGTGRLWDDVFADSRLLYMPPATCALLVLLSRNHNFIAEKLYDINENGTFKKPPPVQTEELIAQDDEIFHRARLVNCGFFMQIILGDYVGAILGLARDGCSWRLNPLMTIREPNHEVTPRGEGNVVSVEFNLLYRWHSALSDEDAQWTEKLFKSVLPTDPNTATKKDFLEAVHKHMIPPSDVRKWTFGKLERQTNGRFKDGELARIIQDSTEHVAGAFRARGIPAALRVVEVMGIEQGRKWGTCSLNEFRKFLGLKPYANFKEWNDDERIHTAAAALYKDIENLELHVGLQAEQAKEPGPGAGLCPGYTISRAILADAVSLSRGDKFLTTEMTPVNFTTWGYNDCQYDKQDGSYGGLLTKLLFRTLPDNYPIGSAYAHFPFIVPSVMEKNVTNSKIPDNYNWRRPRDLRPSTAVTVDTYLGVKHVLSGPQSHGFISSSDDRLFNIMRSALLGHSSTGQGDSEDEDEITRNVQEVLKRGRIAVEHLLQEAPHDRTWADYFKEKASDLIKEHAIPRAGLEGKYIDIVHDVINQLPVYWLSEQIIGLPLKTAANQRGELDKRHVYKMFAAVGQYVHTNPDPSEDWHIREDATDAFKKINESMGDNSTFTRFMSHTTNHHSREFLDRVERSHQTPSGGRPSASIFAAVVPTAAHFSQAIAHVVDFYLDEDKRCERENIVNLAGSLQNHDNVAKIMAYVREALRLNPPVSGVYRTAGKDEHIGNTRVHVGDHVFASIVKANLDTTEFGPDPTIPSYDRPIGKSGVIWLREHGLLSPKFFESTVPAIVGTILGLKNIRRGPGLSGKLPKFTEKWHDCPRQLYINNEGKITPFPDSLTVQFD